MINKNGNNILGAKNNDNFTKKWVIVIFSIWNIENTVILITYSRLWVGASVVLKSVDFKVFEEEDINLKRRRLFRFPHLLPVD